MKKLLKNHWPLIAIVTLLSVVSFYLIKAGSVFVQNPILAGLISEEGFKLNNIHYTQDNPDDGIKWILDAEEAKLSKDRQLISFEKFRFKLEPKNRPSIELEGKKGDYDKASGEITLRGDLKGSTNNGYSLTASHLLYKQKEGYLKTDEPVEINGPFFSVVGQGLFFNLKKETLEIISGVTTLINREVSIL